MPQKKQSRARRRRGRAAGDVAPLPVYTGRSAPVGARRTASGLTPEAGAFRAIIEGWLNTRRPAARLAFMAGGLTFVVLGVLTFVAVALTPGVEAGTLFLVVFGVVCMAVGGGLLLLFWLNLRRRGTGPG